MAPCIWTETRWVKISAVSAILGSDTTQEAALGTQC